MRSLLPTDPALLRRFAAGASLGLATLLALLKLGAAVATGSLAVLSSLIDSLADIVASAITFVSVQISQQPPDRGHRFGHGKAESLSALAQAALVGRLGDLRPDRRRTAAGRPRRRSSRPRSASRSWASPSSRPCCWSAFQRHVVKQTGSQAISADSVHYRADLLTNLSIIASLRADAAPGLALARPGSWVPPIAHLSRLERLSDRPGRRARADGPRAAAGDPPADQGHRPGPSGGAGRCTTCARARPAPTQFIELHVEVDGEMSVGAAHEVTDAIEAELFAAFPAAEVILHQEPAGVEDARLDHRIARAAAAGR